MKIVFLLLPILCCQLLFADTNGSTHQESPDLKSSVILSSGQAFFTSSWSKQRNPGFMAGYRKHYFKNFAFEAFYQYAQNNNFPGFFNHPEKLDAIILGTGMYSSDWDDLHPLDKLLTIKWDEIYLHSLAIKSHFVMSGGKKWFVSAYLAGGAFTSWSSLYRLTEVMFIDYQMIDYKSEHTKKRNNGLFYMPGLEVNYQFCSRYFLGIDLSHFRFIDFKNRPLLTSYDFPVTPEYYYASFVLGIKF